MASDPEGAPQAVLRSSLPQLDEAEAMQLSREHFGISGRITLLPSERDRNFKVVDQEGRAFVLKVSNAAEHPAITRFQTAALRHIRMRAPEMPVPDVRPSITGADAVTVRLGDGTSHVVRLFTYLPGEPLARTVSSLAQTASLGRCVARLDVALGDFRHPAADHDLAWDLRNAARLRPLVDHVGHAGCRAIAARTLDGFEAELLPRLRAMRRRVVHNDLNPHNVLVDPANPARITGVLDFGDMVETHLVCNVAIAAAYQVGNADVLSSIGALVGAYHAVLPLRPEELTVLGDLIMLRQVMSLVIGGWRATLYPDNRAYLLRNEPRATAALTALADIGGSALRARLEAACDTV